MCLICPILFKYNVNSVTPFVPILGIRGRWNKIDHYTWRLKSTWRNCCFSFRWPLHSKEVIATEQSTRTEYHNFLTTLPGVLGAVLYRCTLCSILFCAEGLYLCAKIAELEPCMDWVYRVQLYERRVLQLKQGWRETCFVKLDIVVTWLTKST